MVGLPTVLFLISFLALGAQGCEADRRQCYTGSTTLAPPSASERDAVLLARCHIFCLERILSADSPALPSTATSFLPCQVFRKIMECRGGCMTMAKTPTLSQNHCRNECHVSCQRDCSNTNRCIYIPERSSCTRNCQRKSCRQGCSVYNSILKTIQDEQPPVSPINPPLLTKTELEVRKYDAGVFNVNYNSSEIINSSGFIFTVQDNTSTYFIFQDDISKPLDLGFFACSKVNVSFAIVNAYGTSNYSSPTQVCVHGETRFPFQVNTTTIRFPSILEDTRPGFFGSAVVNITWEKPSGFEYLTHYVLYIYSPLAACRGRSITYNYTIDRELTSYIVRAPYPNAAPSFGDVFESCRYIVFLQSQPVRSTQDQARAFLEVFQATQPPAPLKLSCHKFINKTVGNIAFNITWEIKSENISLEETTLEAISHYNVLLLQQDVTHNLGRPLLSEDITAGCNENLFRNRKDDDYFVRVAYCVRNGAGDYRVHGLRPFNNPNVQYRIRFTPILNQSLFWRRIPGRQECSIDALPEPPTTISTDNIIISDFTLNGTMLFLNISWTPPSETYGEIQQYQVQVGAEPVREEQNPTTHTAFSDGNTSVVINTNEFYVPDELCCIYIQIRSQNAFIWSNWSEPIVLQRHPPTITHPPTETQFPSQVIASTIRFPSILEDTRPGFFGNAVVNVTWDKPSGFEYLTHYVLYINSRSAACGGRFMTYNYTIDRESTSYIVRAPHPNGAPSFGSGSVFATCRYIVYLQSQPAHLTHDRASTLLDVSQTTQPPALLKLSCHKFINKTVGNIEFNITWEIKSENISLEETTLEAISHYSVLLLQRDVTQNLGRPLLSEGITAGCNENLFRIGKDDDHFARVAYCVRNGSGDYRVHGLHPFNNPNVQYRIRFTPILNQSLFWRRIPGTQECSIDALPEPPATVSTDNMIVSDFTLNGTMLFLNISWTPPSETYGEIQLYQVQVGTEPVREEQNPTTHTAFSDGDTSVVISTNEFYVPDEQCCIYIQIRSQNEFIWSNWSEPIVLQRHSPVTSPPTGESDVKQQTSTVYIVSSVVVFVASLVVFVIVSACTCKKYLYKKPKHESNMYIK